LRGPEHFATLTDALTSRGWSASACSKFAHKNWLRVWNAALAERR
jgi:microsomal dipeptidase-like Zn-dependent dipeptidase